MDILLRETDTIWMLDIPGTWVAKDSEEANEVIESNTKYKEVTSVVVSIVTDDFDIVR